MSTTNEITDKQRQTWNKFSGGWEKWDQWVLNWLEPIGAKLLEKADLKPADRVLDVSTGTGEPGLTAATLVAQVVATDVAEDMVAIIPKKAQAIKLANFEAKASRPRICHSLTTDSMLPCAGSVPCISLIRRC